MGVNNNEKIKYRIMIVIAIIVILGLILISVKSLAVVSPTKDFFVNDYAGVLTEETKNYIIQTNGKLQQKKFKNVYLQ